MHSVLLGKAHRMNPKSPTLRPEKGTEYLQIGAMVGEIRSLHQVQPKPSLRTAPLGPYWLCTWHAGSPNGIWQSYQAFVTAVMP